MEMKMQKPFVVALVLLLSVYGYSQAIHIVQPAGGQTFNGDAPITVAWEADPGLTLFSVAYCLVGATVWVPITSTSAKSCIWSAPLLENSATTVRVRVTAANGAEASAGISEPFTIKASGVNDPYEPNNDLATATVIPLDSTFSGAIVYTGYYDTFNDTLNSRYIDEDYFKFSLPGAGILTIQLLPEYSKEVDGFNPERKPPLFMLSDSVQKKGVWCQNGTLRYNVLAGPFSMRVYCGGGAKWCKYGVRISLAQGALPSIRITAPGDTEVFNGDQPVNISWTADTTLSSFTIKYMPSAGTPSITIGTTNARQFTWYAPLLKTACPYGIIRVTAPEVMPLETPQVVIRIRATTAVDPYEPNDDTATAFALPIDTVLSGAFVLGMLDSTNISDVLFKDRDYFSVTLNAATLVTITTLPEFSKSESGYNRSNTIPHLRLLDTAGNQIAGSTTGSLTYYAATNRKCYAVVEASDFWHKYGIRAEVATVTASATSSFSSSAVTKSPDGTYSFRVVSDTTGIAVDGALGRQLGGMVSTAVIDPSSLPGGTTSGGNFMTVSVTADSAVTQALTYADIVLHYDDSELGQGVQEKSITAQWFNDSLGKWVPVEFTIDTVKNLVSVHTTHFSLYGLFTKLPVAVAVPAPVALLHPRLHAAYRQGRIIMRATEIPSSRVAGVVRLYSATGKLILEKTAGFPDAGGRCSAVVNCANTAAGIYLAVIRFGSVCLYSEVAVIR